MKHLFVITLGLLVLSTTYSCKKEGCTYDSATNFSKKAKKDDGSCTFDSRISFWFNQNASNIMMSNGVTELHIYVNDKEVGAIAVTDWSVGADCGGSNFTVANNYTEIEKKGMKYEVRSQNGTLYFEGTFNALPNDCQSIELKY